MKLAPIEAKNKPLDIMEVIVYRRKAITTLWTLVLIALILLFLDLHIYFEEVMSISDSNGFSSPIFSYEHETGYQVTYTSDYVYPETYFEVM